MEPLPADSKETYVFDNKIVGGVVPKEYIPACDKGFKEQLDKGYLIGAPIVGVKVTLNDGNTHPVDSSELAFKLASMAAIRETMPKLGPQILEPIMHLGVEAPSEFQGAITALVSQRRGVITGTNSSDNYVELEAKVPLGEMFGFATVLRSSTQGKGEFQMTFDHYAPVPKSIQDELVKLYQEKKKNEAA